MRLRPRQGAGLDPRVNLRPVPASQPLLRIANLHFAHPGRPLFQGLFAELPAGVCLVCGDEGRGKSTLLRLLSGALVPDQGELLLDSRPLAPQDVAWFDPGEPARDAQIVSDILQTSVPPEHRAALDRLVPTLGLQAHLHKPLYQLSTGSRRKVFLAAALAQQARLTLLDQPFMALDRPSVDALLAAFATWTGQDGRWLLLADHTAPPGLPLAATLDLDISA